MSRIGKLPVPIGQGVTVSIDKNTITVKGPKGQLTRDFLPEINGLIMSSEFGIAAKPPCNLLYFHYCMKLYIYV